LFSLLCAHSCLSHSLLGGIVLETAGPAFSARALLFIFHPV
jgi:hypothetical protein